MKKDLGSKVTIDLGEAGTVYEFDTGKCLGTLSKIEIERVWQEDRLRQRLSVVLLTAVRQKCIILVQTSP